MHDNAGSSGLRLLKEQAMSAIESPVAWQPDSSAPYCTTCTRDFHTLRRRHHCRACGLVFCSSCSAKRGVVPGEHGRVRICDLCDYKFTAEAIRLHEEAGGEGKLQRVYTTPEMARASYDSMASYYDLWSSYEAPHVEAGIGALKLQAAETVLEIGCGTGKAAAVLAKAVQPGGLYFGIDISEQMVTRARGKLAAAGLASATTLYAADVTSPLPNLVAPSSCDFDASDGVDAVFLSFTLELFDTPKMPIVLRTCHDALREGGRLVIVCMARGKDKKGFGQRMYELAHEMFPHTVDCRPIDAAPLLTASGFTVKHVEARAVYGLPVEVVTAEKGRYVLE